jgi:CheY-specific phosphatase CheX
MAANDHHEAMQRIFGDVLEQMAFMFADPADTAEVEPMIEAGLRAHMRFRGPFRGELRLAVPQEMCPVLAQNMLGVGPEDERVMDRARDALKEVLNVTCGGVLTELAGDEPVFDLTVPEIDEIVTEDWQGLAEDPDTAAFLVDDYPALLQLRIEPAE